MFFGSACISGSLRNDALERASGARRCRRLLPAGVGTADLELVAVRVQEVHAIVLNLRSDVLRAEAGGGGFRRRNRGP